MGECSTGTFVDVDLFTNLLFDLSWRDVLAAVAGVLDV